jgi:hypothetical protein
MAVGALTLLLSPFQGFELLANAGLTSLIVAAFLCYFSPICEQQKTIITRQLLKPFPNFGQQFIGAL